MSHNGKVLGSFVVWHLEKYHIYSHASYSCLVYARGCQFYSFCHLKQYDKGIQSLHTLNFWMRKFSVLEKRKKKKNKIDQPSSFFPVCFKTIGFEKAISQTLLKSFFVFILFCKC